ncbi:hypothetical protein AKJ50_00425 [candidate division MSBL1 archaeon SCGC-AAA382A13]|uniref:Phosphate transport regulator n=1 Tax=candidate division MSBL1 archaeon SCGC-AAA382A13 TaxID=1698279 RepID=A0A133VGR9_9EURY|nr:hypothetical protein AKJ50_00425 [candidate division MSBL1 archaeon SCGC-AAA382A13]
MPEKSIAWLGREKERKALELCIEHMDKILETVKLMDEVVYSFVEGEKNLRREADKILEKEREADDIKEKIMNELSKGRYLPLSREKIIRLTITAEGVADNARAAGAKLTFLDPSIIDEDIKEGLNQLSHFAHSATEILRDTYKALLVDEDVEESIQKTERVEKMEEKVDFFRANTLIPQIVKWADDSQKPGTAILLMEIEENMEEITDHAENTADAIREIALGSR